MDMMKGGCTIVAVNSVVRVYRPLKYAPEEKSKNHFAYII